MASDSHVQEALTVLLEEADTIIARRNFYGLRRKIPKSHEKQFDQDKSFDQMVTQGINTRDFNDWYRKLEVAFVKYGLQPNKFKRKADSFNPDTESNTPAMIFTRRVTELDKMTEDAKYLDSYYSPAAAPVITYENGVLTQGRHRHRFTKKPHRDLIKLLWSNRKIITPKCETVLSGKPMPRKEAEFKLNINHDEFEKLARAVIKGAKDNKIKMTVCYPKDVYLELKQDAK